MHLNPLSLDVYMWQAPQTDNKQHVVAEELSLAKQIFACLLVSLLLVLFLQTN